MFSNLEKFQNIVMNSDYPPCVSKGLLDVYRAHHSIHAYGLYAVMMVGLVATSWGVVATDVLLGWLFSGLLLMAATMATLHRFTRDRNRDERLAGWAWRFVASSAAHGVLWGTGAILMFDPAYGTMSMVPLLFSVGFSIGASHAKVAIPLCAYVTFMPGLGLSALAVGRHDAPGTAYMAVFLVMLAMFGIIFTVRSHRLLVETLRLNMANAGLAQQMGEAREAAERASTAKSKFLAVLSHEVRTPLNAMMGIIEVLRDARLEEHVHCQIGTLGAAAAHIRSMVDDIVDFSRAEAGGMVPQPRVFDLGALIDDIGELFREAAAARGNELHVRRCESCTGHWQGDDKRLRQVIVNLLDNAVKNTSLGRIRLTAQCRGTDLELSVEDEGPGIPREEWETVFEPFVRASGDRKGTGLGLGLAICRQLVGLMGGRIWIEPSTGGSHFRFVVPLQPVASPRRVSRKPDAMLFDGQVLVVEDSDPGREAIAAMVGSLGARVDVAADGPQAIAKAARQRYDLILMDFFLPGMDGRHALAGIRRAEAEAGLPPVPVVLATAGLPEDDGPAPDHGFPAVLTKPFAMADLMAVMARYLPASDGQGGEGQGGEGGVSPQAMVVDDINARTLDEVAALKRAYERRDFPGVARLAHRLKGMAGVLSMAETARCAARLELAGSEGAVPAEALVELENALAADVPQWPRLKRTGAAPTGDARVLVVDDHEMVREGLRRILNEQPDFTVVGEAADGIECIRALRTVRPQLVLLDLSMPKMGGAEVISEIRHRSPETRIVIVTGATSPILIRNAAAAGADAIVNKEVPADELCRILRAVMAGTRLAQPKPPADGPELSRRERQVLQLIVEGNRTRDIAATLGLSERTVEKHRASLARKLGTSTPAEMASWAVRHGFVG